MSQAGTLPATVDIGRETLERMSKVDRYNTWLYSKVAPYIGDRVLEVGSGTGNMSIFFVDRDRLVLSDLSEYYQRDLVSRYGDRSNVRVMAWDLEQPPPQELVAERLDTVLCLNVLEHIRMDDLALDHMARCLAPGGRLLLMVPAMKGLYGTLDRHLDHFRRYGRKECARKLERAGLRVDRIFFMNFFGMFGWFLNSRVFRRQILSTRQLFLFNKFAPLFIALERHIHVPCGLSLVAVGVKPGDETRSS